MARKKKSGSKVKHDDEQVESITKSFADLIKVKNDLHSSIAKEMKIGSLNSRMSNLPAHEQKKQKELEEEAEKELNIKLLSQKLGLEKVGRVDDGDQSLLRGDKAQVMRNQWGGGMDYNPAHPSNGHLSPWLRALWRGDYQAVMEFVKGLENHEISNLLEVRESLLNVSAVFHVIIGARTLCGKNPLFRDIQIAARRMMEVKNDHQKILTKLLELGANIHAKDIAGYTPLHHCLTTYSNPTTMSMAKQLLVAGADPNLQNRFGCTPLFEPVMAANFEAVKLLLDYGANPDIKENDGISCRYTASFLPKISELFCRADKKNVKHARTSAKVEAGGSLRPCKVCGADDDNKRCTGCYLVWYCGQKCQGEDWPQHKEDCKKTMAEYKKVELIEYAVAGRDNITKEMYVHKVGDVPNKKHFVVKVQIALGELKGTTENPISPDGAGHPMFVYNRDRSLCGYLQREGAEEVYDLLFKNIREKGFKGQKGFYYAIHTGGNSKNAKKKNNPDNIMEVKINPVRMLPLEKW